MANFDFSVGSSAQRVCVAGSDDRFEIWSVDAGEILPFRVDGDPVFVGGSAGLCAVVDVPGDYRIEFADDYCPEDNAPVFSVGPADAADVCCVAAIKDADGKLVGLTIDGSDELFEAGLEYTFPATVGPDGVMTVTDSNGGSQTVTIEFPEDVDIASNSVVGGVVQFLDSNGDALPDLDIDLNPYISSPHPIIAASGDATATFDAVTNTWAIGFVDTDTTYTMTQNANGDTVLTPSDGSPAQVILNTDTDVSSVKLEWVTDRLRSTVTEDGVDLVGELVIPDGPRECGDRALIVDPVTGGIELKETKPYSLTGGTLVFSPDVLLTGAAVDIMNSPSDVLLSSVTGSVTPFNPVSDCYLDEMHVYERAGHVNLRIGTPGDIWEWRIAQNGSFQLTGNQAFSWRNNGTGVAYENIANPTSADRQIVDKNNPSSYGMNHFGSAIIYTPHPDNYIFIQAQAVLLIRKQYTIGALA